MVSRYSLRIALGVLLSIAISSTAFGQCDPNARPPCKVPSTTGAVVWVAASAAVAVVAVYVLHKSKSKDDSRYRNSFVGCTELTEYGTVLTDEKDHEPYVILPGSIPVKPGERVEVLAKKDEDSAGRIGIQVGKLVKDYGACKSPKITESPSHVS